MRRVFITGSADGLGRASAQALLEHEHDVVVHARGDDRLAAVRDLVDRGAEAVIGTWRTRRDACRRRAGESAWRDGCRDPHAGVYRACRSCRSTSSRRTLTAQIHRPKRLIYLSGGLHRGGRADAAGMD